MISVTERPDNIEFDYYRQLVRKPPSKRNRAAHLAWVRIMAKMLSELEQWVPFFTTALVAKKRTVEVFRPFCEQGVFERSYFEQKPRQLLFLEHFFSNSDCKWLTDLGRTELWLNCLRKRVPDSHWTHSREMTGVQRMEGQEFIVVSHDVLETLQALTGFMDMTLSRAGRLLWFLNVDPIYPVLEPTSSTGIVVFVESEGEWGLSYLAAPQS